MSHQWRLLHTVNYHYQSSWRMRLFPEIEGFGVICCKWVVISWVLFSWLFLSFAGIDDVLTWQTVKFGIIYSFVQLNNFLAKCEMLPRCNNRNPAQKTSKKSILAYGKLYFERKPTKLCVWRDLCYQGNNMQGVNNIYCLVTMEWLLFAFVDRIR